jgi:hypothetical protein
MNILDESVVETCARALDPETFREYDAEFKKHPRGVSFGMMELYGKVESARQSARSCLEIARLSLEIRNSEQIENFRCVITGLNQAIDDYWNDHWNDARVKVVSHWQQKCKEALENTDTPRAALCSNKREASK